jgi:ribosomal protein S15P/S13E
MEKVDKWRQKMAENLNEKNIIKELALNSFDTENGYYFTKDLLGYEIHGCFNCKNEQLNNLTNMAKNVFKHIEELNKNAKNIIQENYPDEDVDELPLDDIIFYDDNTFSFGYPTEETEAGQEYIYVKFDKDFKMGKELIYEYY